MDILEEARRVLDIEADAIHQVKAKLGQSFIDAVDLICHCKGKVVVSGLGKSGLIGRKIAATLASTGTPAIFMHPAEGVHGDLGILMRGDIVILISKSGETEEIIRIIKSIKRIGVHIIAITGNPESTLGHCADIVIDISVEKEACPNNLAPTASTTALLAIGDALAVVMLKKRSFTRDDFAQLHPSGSLGRRLLLRVEDIMHSGEASAVVEENASMKEAIIEMTSKRLGAVCVVDIDGRLRGIITDGDLRRAIEKYEGKLFTCQVKRIMTANPVSICIGSLAIDAIGLMENRKNQISQLPIIDASFNLKGLLRLHDLFQARIV